MSIGKKYTILIVCAAAIGGVTQAAGLFPDIKEILMATNVLIGAIMIFVNKPVA